MIDALMGNYGRFPLAFERGEGAWLQTSDGERYLDCTSGIAVMTLGHSHPALVEALCQQARKLWHVSNLYRIPEQEAAAATLARLSGLDRAFFCNSGVEATEAAVKIARRAMHHKGQTSRHTILCSEGAFHGRTIAMLAATDRPAFREGFGPMPEGFGHFSFGNMNDLRTQLLEDAQSGAPTIAAVMVEQVQGDGGAKPLPAGFIKQLRDACDEVGCFLIADEVQIGVGRSGYLFSYEQSGIMPDIVAMAKGLGGGFPVGAVLAREEIAQALTPGSHGSTFGGNPLAMVAVKTVLDVLTGAGFLESVRDKSARLMESLIAIGEESGGVFAPRGQGFLVGLAMTPPHEADAMITALQDNKVLAVKAAENTVRLLPPLIISDDEIDILIDAVKKSIHSIAN